MMTRKKKSQNTLQVRNVKIGLICLFDVFLRKTFPIKIRKGNRAKTILAGQPFS